MQTAQDFFDDFLAEKAVLHKAYRAMSLPFYIKYFDSEYVEYTERWNQEREAAPERFVRAEILKDSAKMITAESSKNKERFLRYQLRNVEERWEIHRMEINCFLCKGTGKSGDNPCKHCNGEGWINLR